MYYDYSLKFDSEQTANTILFNEYTDNVEGINRTFKSPKYLAVDVIGTIYKPTGNTLTTETGPIEEVQPVPGWHANVRNLTPLPELEPYMVFPTSPVRMWA